MMHGYDWFERGCGFGSAYGGWSHWLMMIGLVLIVGALIYMAIRRSPRRNDALDTLQELYVRGEITEEEYLNRKATIKRK